jgi:hypothetical protein
MTALVSVESVLLVVLLLLVAGLLRSNAEILRRLGPPSAEGSAEATIPPPPARSPGSERPAAALSGPTPGGDAVMLDFAAAGSRPTLLAFLSTGCSTCAGFWETLGERRLAPEIQTVIVAHGAERERPRRLASLAPAGVPVVMSSQAWEDYAVPASPYFVLVDGSVLGEGAASSWPALASLVSDAIEDQEMTLSRPPGVGGGSLRTRRIDEALAASGIGPGHPSLYPGGTDASAENDRDRS